jgi:hypothetical protein
LLNRPVTIGLFRGLDPAHTVQPRGKKIIWLHPARLKSRTRAVFARFSDGS